MLFEWDENKRALNIQDHGVDFRLAAGIFLEPVIEKVDTRQNYGEPRIRALGVVSNECFLVVYTWRGDSRRIISAWKVGKDGKRRYQEILSRGN